MSVTIEQAAASYRRRVEAANERAQARAQALRLRLDDARDLLTKRYGATRVFLFGSLATGDVHEASDVDLAVEGLPGVTYIDALADLMTLLETRVDLVRLEDASPSLVDRIHAEGQLL